MRRTLPPLGAPPRPAQASTSAHRRDMPREVGHGEAQGRDAVVGVAGRAGSRAARDRNLRQPAVTPGKRGTGRRGLIHEPGIDPRPTLSIPPTAARALPPAHDIRWTRAISAGCSASSVPGGSSVGRARGRRQRRPPARREGAATARSARPLPPAVRLTSRRPLTGTTARPMPPTILCVAVCEEARSELGITRE
ncbi:unnamed protein product [Urochloa humidicola]